MGGANMIVHKQFELHLRALGLVPNSTQQLQDLSQLYAIDQLHMMVPRQGKEAHTHMGGKCRVQATPVRNMNAMAITANHDLRIHRVVEMGKNIFEKH